MTKVENIKAKSGSCRYGVLIFRLLCCTVAGKCKTAVLRVIDFDNAILN
jgi:hypothetical protein